MSPTPLPSFNGPFNATHSGPFPGSIQEEAAQPVRLLRLMDQTFALLAVAAAAAMALLASAGAGAPWPDALKLASCALLMPAVAGLWLVEQVHEEPASTVARIMDMVGQRLRSGQTKLAVPTHHDEPAERSLANTIADGVERFLRLRAAAQTAAEAARATNTALLEGRVRAANLADRMREDGAALAESASGIMAGASRLAMDAHAAGGAASATVQDLGAAAARAASLTAAVSAVTHQITQMTGLAVQASEKAFGTQSAIAAMHERTNALDTASEAVGRALELAQIGVSPSSPDGVPDALAQTLGELARSTRTALTDMLTTVAELRADAERAGARAADLGEMIHAQQQLGRALSYAVEQQGEDIAQLFMVLQRAHSGLATLRAGVEAVTSGAATGMADAEALRGAANRVPAHADAVAGILHAIPDFRGHFEF